MANRGSAFYEIKKERKTMKCISEYRDLFIEFVAIGNDLYGTQLQLLNNF